MMTDHEKMADAAATIRALAPAAMAQWRAANARMHDVRVAYSPAVADAVGAVMPPGNGEEAMRNSSAYEAECRQALARAIGYPAPDDPRLSDVLAWVAAGRPANWTPAPPRGRHRLIDRAQRALVQTPFVAGDGYRWCLGATSIADSGGYHVTSTCALQRMYEGSSMCPGLKERGPRLSPWEVDPYHRSQLGIEWEAVVETTV